MKKTFLVLLLSILTGCAIFQTPQKRAQNHLRKAISLDPSIAATVTKVRDSVIKKDSIVLKDSVKLVLKDSVVVKPATELEGKVEKPCDSTGKLKPIDVTLRAGDHRLRVWSDKDGTLLFRSNMDSVISRYQLEQREHKQLKEKYDSLSKTSQAVTSKTITIKEPFIPWWVWAIIGAEAAIIVVLVLRPRR